MRLLQRVLCKFNLMRKKFNSLEQSRLREMEIEVIHSKGRITPEEKAFEWERAGVCAPLEYMGEVSYQSRCNFYSKDCHQCLKDFASYKKSYDPYSDDFDLIPDYNMDDNIYMKKTEISCNKRLVKRR